MADVIYVLSSLPHVELIPDMDVFSSMDEFVDAIQALNENVFEEALLAITNPKESNLAIAQRWAEYEYSIKNELARHRFHHRRQGAYESVFIHGSVPVTAEGLESLDIAQQEHNPYLREIELIDIKWRTLELLDAEYQLKLENIIIYGWKLQLYYAYRNLTEERGKEQWGSLLETLAEKSNFSISAITGGF